MSDRNQQESDEMIQDLAENHPEYTIEQFVGDFKSLFKRDPTFDEKRAFIKDVKAIKRSFNTPSNSCSSGVSARERQLEEKIEELNQQLKLLATRQACIAAQGRPSAIMTTASVLAKTANISARRAELIKIHEQLQILQPALPQGGIAALRDYLANTYVPKEGETDKATKRALEEKALKALFNEEAIDDLLKEYNRLVEVAEKDDLLLLLPDYSKSQVIFGKENSASWNGTFTVTENGWVFVRGYNNSKFLLNGRAVGDVRFSYSGDGACLFCPVRSGDVCGMSGGSYDHFAFYPCLKL